MFANQFLFLAAASLALSFSVTLYAADAKDVPAPNLSAADALKVLKDGNERFTSGKATHPHQDAARIAEVAKGQKPFAIILSCADSRIPPEMVFDQGLGDLFIVRVAGNLVNDEGLGSIEYAVAHFGTNLIIVMGHEACGAVTATRDVVAGKAKAIGHITSLVEAIKPAVNATKDKDVEATVKENVANQEKTLEGDTTIIKEQIDDGKVVVIGAYYDLKSGHVTILDEHAAKAHK